MTRRHHHYFKPCPYDHVDVYRVLELFGIADPALQHAIKKLLMAGGRGGGKDIHRDIQEAIDTLARWQEMRQEETDNLQKELEGLQPVINNPRRKKIDPSANQPASTLGNIVSEERARWLPA